MYQNPFAFDQGFFVSHCNSLLACCLKTRGLKSCLLSLIYRVYVLSCLLGYPLPSLLVTIGHLICTLISEKEGLEKLRSVSNFRKISGHAHLDFFSVCHLDFFQVYGINLAFFQGGDLKKTQVCRT